MRYLIFLLTIFFSGSLWAQDWPITYQRGIDNQSSTLTTPTQTMTNTATCTSGSTCAWTANALTNGMGIVFSGSVPTPLTAGTTYYVVNQAANAYNVASSPGGGAITLTSTTSPTATIVVAPNSLIANNKTPGSITVPLVTNLTRMLSGSSIIRRARLQTNVTTGWDQSPVTVRLWSSAPTYTNGNFGPYAVATGAAKFIGQFNIILNQFGDGASGQGVTPYCGPVYETLVGSGNTTIYWDLQSTGASVNPVSAQTFTLTLEMEK